MIDIYHSRRTKYYRCEYWNRNEDDRVGDASRWILNNKPSGSFYAELVNNVDHQQNQVNNTMMFDRNMTTLLTSDTIDGLSRGSIILFNGHAWMVDSIQLQPHKKESEFGELEFNTYISIRR